MNLLEILHLLGDNMNEARKNFLLLNNNFTNNELIEYLINEQDKFYYLYKNKIDNEHLLTLKFILDQSKIKLLNKVYDKR